VQLLLVLIFEVERVQALTLLVAPTEVTVTTPGPDVTQHPTCDTASFTLDARRAPPSPIQTQIQCQLETQPQGRHGTESLARTAIRVLSIRVNYNHLVRFMTGTTGSY
jgi:hypothetical protein